MKNHRTAKFTSSGIHVLIKKGRGNDFSAPGLTYIEEKRLENKLGRSLDTNAYSRPIAWGNLMEKIVWMNHFEDWNLISDDYRNHPSDEFKDVWSGMPDLKKTGKIGEIKSYQLKKFAQYSDCLMKKDIELLKKNFAQEYWQIVSNCILNDIRYGVAISYMPYFDELEVIIDAIENTGLLEKFEFDPWQYRWLVEEDIHELPYIERGGYFQNVTAFEFEIPTEDIILLTERVRMAKKLLK